MSTVEVYSQERAVGSRLAALHRPACALWLAGAAVETLVGVLARWPAQFGGAGDPARIHTQWLSKGTALSPPAFLLVGMLVALAVLVAARRDGTARVGAALAGIVGLIGVVGALGELLATPTPRVPAGAQDAAVIGVLISLAVVVTAVPFLRRPPTTG